MAVLADVIRRGTRAAQPAATTVAIGTLYFVSDESVFERSNGSVWQSVEGAGGAAAHAPTHAAAGADPLDITTLDGFPGGTTDFLREDGTFQPVSGGGSHASTHEDGGADEINVDGLSGLLADEQVPVDHASTHQNGGGDEISVAGLSGLLADAQTPTAHATSHKSGGSDAIKLDELAAPTDVTTLNATTSAHGLLKKLSNVATEFMNGVGSWATPAGGSSKPFLQWTPLGNQPPASAYATPDTRNSHAVLDFDGSTDEEAVFAGVLPVGYAAGGLTVELYVAFTSATTGSVRFQAGFERIDVSSLDIDADSFAAFQSAGGSAPGTSGHVIKIAITFTDGAQMDSVAAGEAFRLKVRRDADGTSGTDDITSDCELLRVVMRET